MKNKFTLIVVADPDEVKQLKIYKKLFKKDIVKVCNNYYMCLTGIGKYGHDKFLRVITAYKDKIIKVINLGLAAGSKKYKLFDIVKIDVFTLLADSEKNKTKLDICYTTNNFLDCPVDQDYKWVVDMEAFYFDKICKINNVPFESYKIIVDRGSYIEYQNNLKIGISYFTLILNKIINNILLGVKIDE